MEVGCPWGRTTLVMCDLCTLYCMCDHEQEQQLPMPTGEVDRTEADVIREQQSCSRHKQGAVGSGHMRLVLARDATTQGLLVRQSMELHAVCWAHADVVKEARPLKHTGSIPMSALKRRTLQT